jgi:hypothetical protein
MKRREFLGTASAGASLTAPPEANLANLAQGPAGRAGQLRLRASLAERQLELPVLGDDDATANHGT